MSDTSYSSSAPSPAQNYGVLTNIQSALQNGVAAINNCSQILSAIFPSSS